MKATPNQRLKQFREKAGLRLEAIAAELDVSVSILQKVDQDRNRKVKRKHDFNTCIKLICSYRSISLISKYEDNRSLVYGRNP